jgi:photosystem I P700 chlorophyll a apoprotein A2
VYTNGGIQLVLELTKNYAGSIGLLLSSVYYLLVGYIYSQNFVQVYLGFKNNESRLNHHLSGLLGVSSLAWTGHLVHVAIPVSRGVHIGWDNF